MLYYKVMVGTMVPEGFTSLEEAWPGLLEDSMSNHIFLTPQWQRAWWRVFGRGHELQLFSVRDGSGLVGIAPMMRRGGRLSFIGSSDVCDYMDFIARRGREDFFAARLLDYLETLEWQTMELESLPPHSLALDYLAPLARQRGYRLKVEQMDVSPQLLLPPSWEEYLARLKTKDRHELRRKLRRLEQAGAARYTTITGKGELPGGMAGFFELFRMSDLEKASFMTEPKRAFFETMVASLAEEGYVRLSFMEVGGVRASAALCFDYNNEIYLYNSAYNPAYAPLSVSLLLKAHCIREAITSGKRRFDFLRGNEPYKYDLGGQDVSIYRCLVARS